MGRALEKGFAGGQLPAGQALGDDEFEEGADDDGPQDARAQQAAGEARGRQVARTDASGGKQEAGSDRGEKAGGGVRSFGRGHGWAWL